MMVERCTPTTAPEAIRVTQPFVVLYDPPHCGCAGPCGCEIAAIRCDFGIERNFHSPARVWPPQTLEASVVPASPPTNHSPFIGQRRPIRDLCLTLVHRVGSMKNSWKFRFVIAVLISVICLLAALFATHAEARSKPATPATCQALWEALPPGERFPAKQACLRQILVQGCKTKPRFVPRSVRVKGSRAGSNQRHVLGWVVSEGIRRRLARKVVLAAIVATTQESTATELHGGEGTSAGPFQLTNAHGELADRITVEFSGNWFFNGAAKIRHRSMTAPQLAQAVERSGFPSAYAQWLPEAMRTLPAIAGPCHVLLQ